MKSKRRAASKRPVLRSPTACDRAREETHDGAPEQWFEDWKGELIDELQNVLRLWGAIGEFHDVWENYTVG